MLEEIQEIAAAQEMAAHIGDEQPDNHNVKAMAEADELLARRKEYRANKQDNPHYNSHQQGNIQYLLSPMQFFVVGGEFHGYNNVGEMNTSIRAARTNITTANTTKLSASNPVLRNAGLCSPCFIRETDKIPPPSPAMK